MSDVLSAEELAQRQLTLLRLAARGDPTLRRAVEDVEAHFEAQAREIDAYRTALEKIWLRDHLSHRARQVAGEALASKGIPE